MKQVDYLKNMEDTYAECMEISKKKSSDYSGKDNSFANFLNAQVVGVSVERGILVRIMDKIARVSNLLDKNPEVVEESLDDTLKDAINYLAILRVYVKNKST